MYKPKKFKIHYLYLNASLFQLKKMVHLVLLIKLCYCYSVTTHFLKICIEVELIYSAFGIQQIDSVIYFFIFFAL